jgi:hypothetical protein
MSGSVQTGLIAQNGNTTVTYAVGVAPTVWTAWTEGVSAVGLRRHNSLPGGGHHVNVEVVGAAATTLRIGGYVI